MAHSLDDVVKSRLGCKTRWRKKKLAYLTLIHDKIILPRVAYLYPPLASN